MALKTGASNKATALSPVAEGATTEGTEVFVEAEPVVDEKEQTLQISVSLMTKNLSRWMNVLLTWP